MSEYLSLSETAELVGKCKETLRRWDNEGILTAVREPVSNYRVYRKSDVHALMGNLFENAVDNEISNYVKPDNEYSVLELFAGAGGLAVGLEKSGLNIITIRQFSCFCPRKAFF